jgi:uncharacterized membrane protein SpoIIM required for sporulation
VTPSLKSAAFRAEREGTWKELEGELTRLERYGLPALASSELTRLPVLYRAALSSLSVARAISLDHALVAYLEALSARAYIAVYAPRRHAGVAVREFLGRRFPSAVRAHAWHVLLSATIIVLGVWAGFHLTAADPERFYAFVDPAMASGRGPGSSAEALRKVLYDEGSTKDALTTFAMFLFSHNAQIGFLAVAVGVLGGVPSALLMFANGLVLGAFAQLYAAHGLSMDFWAWVLPHGVTELSAVVLCGAAGLVLGQAVVFPGREERLAGLTRRGRDAGVIAVGAVVLFFVAGLIEGIFRQLVQSVPVRVSVAVVTAVLWGAYFTLAGRRP